MLVLACNTATSQALPLVRDLSPVPVLGVVRPGAVAAAASTRVGHVGVIATAGTVASGAYPAAILEADPRLSIAQEACPDLVPLVESGRLDDPTTGRRYAATWPTCWPRTEASTRYCSAARTTRCSGR